MKWYPVTQTLLLKWRSIRYAVASSMRQALGGNSAARSLYVSALARINVICIRIIVKGCGQGS